MIPSDARTLHPEITAVSAPAVAHQRSFALHLPIDTCQGSEHALPDLTEVIAAWPSLAPSVRARVLALVRRAQACD